MSRRTTLRGLAARPDLNGLRGEVESFDDVAGRYAVRLDSTGNVVRVKPANLTRAPPPTALGDEPPPPPPPPPPMPQRSSSSFGGLVSEPRYEILTEWNELEGEEEEAAEEELDEDVEAALAVARGPSKEIVQTRMNETL